ncbi:MAG TPA: hypothetical protein V6D17_07690 [Candidatus Obscuribacterales bacterium]
MKGVLKALVSLAPVVAACYLLSSLKGHAALLLVLFACFGWCAWTIYQERRKLALRQEQMQLDISASSPAYEAPAFCSPNVQETVLAPPTDTRAARLPVKIELPVVNPPASDNVRQFPMHKLTRRTAGEA